MVMQPEQWRGEALGTTTPRVPAWVPAPCSRTWESGGGQPKHTGFLPPLGSPRRSSPLLASAWPHSSCHGHLGRADQSVEALSVCRCAFQITINLSRKKAACPEHPLPLSGRRTCVVPAGLVGGTSELAAPLVSLSWGKPRHRAGEGQWMRAATSITVPWTPSVESFTNTDGNGGREMAHELLPVLVLPPSWAWG